MVERVLIYRGDAAFAAALVQMLEAEGLTVSWTPPGEQRSAGEHALAVVDLTISGVAGAAIIAAAKAASAKFKTRFPGRAEVDLDDKEDEA